MGGGSKVGLIMRYQHLVSFSLEHLTSLTFFDYKIDVAAPKLMFLDTYLIIYIEISNAHSVKDNDQHANNNELVGVRSSQVILK